MDVVAECSRGGIYRRLRLHIARQEEHECKYRQSGSTSRHGAAPVSASPVMTLMKARAAMPIQTITRRP
jgi:hypothetical protein